MSNSLKCVLMLCYHVTKQNFNKKLKKEELKKKWNSNQNTSGVKEVAAKNLKKAMLKMMWNLNGRPRPSVVNGIKIFDNDDHIDQAAKQLLSANCLKLKWQATVTFCSLVIIIKNFNSINSNQQVHFDLSSFTVWPFLDSWLQLFYTRGVDKYVYPLWSTLCSCCFIVYH